LTFPDFDLASKRNEKFGYCGLDLVWRGEYAGLPDVAIVGAEKFWRFTLHYVTF